MSEIVILTESAKTDIRNNETQILEGLVQQKLTETKEPRLQFYAINYQQSFENTLNKNQPILPLNQNLNGFLIPNYSDAFYTISGPPTNPTAFHYNLKTLDYKLLDFANFTKLDLFINFSWLRYLNDSFPTNFQFDIYLNFVEITNVDFTTITTNDFEPLLQINCGTVFYNALANSITRLNFLQILNLSENFSIIQDFTFKNEVLSLKENQYKKITIGETSLAYYFGFDSTSISNEAKTFLINGLQVLNTCITLNYQGLKKI